MLLKSLIYEDFVNYKKPSMFIGCHSCTFKCDKLSGRQVCQNGALANAPNIEVSIDKLVEEYINNQYIESVVFGGLEPFDDIEHVIEFISKLREKGNTDDVIIYTGYTENEINEVFSNYVEELKRQKNIIIKYGRFIPDNTSRFDEVLGVNLHSSNQYAKRIS